ncbi:histidine phosphatase family protein [Paenibacillus sp. YPG26]|uniref:histidine phosphatase family protein n=1 Tax=Paenibacillus sp. YPG26 TaxID=2878915 RepID=UPI00203B15FC|nr:histidine phosphatase family protein [Paenibacillus sp. YPG26]USB34783.1 histidine phosphatase family protein [Paenibacillus sp. YPG26]
MLVGLIRHGLTDWNALGKIQGQSDIPLNEEGRRQASLLARRLKDEPYKWDFVITSGLSRAQESGEIIAAELGIPVYDPDSRLMERAFGQVEGMTSEERETLWGIDWRLQDLGQEKDQEVQARALAFLTELGERYADKNVLVISHGGLLAQLYTALYQDMLTERIGNLSLTILEKSEHTWEARLYNCLKHLQENDQ